MHDKQKSLPIALQFIDRFARTDSGQGPATFITNIANDVLNNALSELLTAQEAYDYSELTALYTGRAIVWESSNGDLFVKSITTYR